ncbi:DedA family protein [Clostridium sp. B9]|uniref:DedA family protein n=1 Tax=Clostridium sp. B9 TaxID=3423224 RepID=UPI003D2F0A96
MSIDAVLNYFATYGLTLLFIIVFLEYLNLPGLPAGIIMPAAGLLASKNNESLILIVFISVVAGVLGSIVLYFIGYYGGALVLDKLESKFPKTSTTVDKTREILNERGVFGVFLCRLLPVLRTIVSIIAGAVRMNFFKFIIYSTPGIFLWNLCFIFSGYFFGDILFK